MSTLFGFTEFNHLTSIQFAFLILLSSQTFYSATSSTTIGSATRRRSISTFIRDGGEGATKSIILVKTNREQQGDAIIEQLKKHLNGTEGIESDSSSDSSTESDDSDDEKDMGDSEERNPEDLTNLALSPVKLHDSEQKRPDDVISIINSAFNDRKTFSCPKTKTDLLTGTTTANISPEDIGIIAAMGDSLATGAGLWPRTDIEFRGAAFPIGGDATIDGLVTVPNILREFIPSNHLYGVSHGMGLRDQLPEHQLNVAMAGASSASLVEQAGELVKRIKGLKEVDTWNTWTLLIITIGTEEICGNCTGPDTSALMDALDVLNRGIHKAFVVLVGPIHVSSSFQQQANLLKTRCLCSRDRSNEFMLDLSAKWTRAFEQVQAHVQSVKRKTFNALALPMLTVHSRYPYSLFIPNKPLLNRRGHNYAAKWLWNRLIAGPKYNLSNAVLSQDAYFCPSLGCPYFRTPDNFNQCEILTHAGAEMRRVVEEYEREQKARNGSRFGSRVADLYFITLLILGIALLLVLTLGTFFYKRSKQGDRGRFDVVQASRRVCIPEYNFKKPGAANRRQPTADDQIALTVSPATVCESGSSTEK